MSDDKAQLRRRFLAQRAALAPADKQRIDHAICAHVLESAIFRHAGCVFLYVSTPQEIDTRALLRAALQAGKTVCVPRCGRAGEMEAHWIRSLDGLRPGAFGIDEPDQSASVV